MHVCTHSTLKAEAGWSQKPSYVVRLHHEKKNLDAMILCNQGNMGSTSLPLRASTFLIGKMTLKGSYNKWSNSYKEAREDRWHRRNPSHSICSRYWKMSFMCLHRLNVPSFLKLASIKPPNFYFFKEDFLKILCMCDCLHELVHVAYAHRPVAVWMRMALMLCTFGPWLVGQWKDSEVWPC